MNEHAAQSVALLATISYQLYWVIGIVLIDAMAQLARLGTQMWRDFTRVREQDFEQKAERLFERGEFTELVRITEQWLADRPNSPTALWWCARAHFELEHHPVARERFAKLLRVEPSWREHIQPYMERLSQSRHRVQ